MAVVRIHKKEKNYTTVYNSVINDIRLSAKTLGIYLRLISKEEGWEIKATGLATIYPTEGRDSYTSAFKELCKYGYLIKVPLPRKAGQFQKPICELYERSQFEEELTDQEVELLFSKDPDQNEIQKIYTKRITRFGEPHSGEDAQQKKEEEKKEKKQQQCKNNDEDPTAALPAAAFSKDNFKPDDDAQPKYDPPDPKPHNISQKVRAALKSAGLSDHDIVGISKLCYPENELIAAAKLLKEREDVGRPGGFIRTCLEEKWYKETRKKTKVQVEEEKQQQQQNTKEKNQQYIQSMQKYDYSTWKDSQGRELEMRVSKDRISMQHKDKNISTKDKISIYVYDTQANMIDIWENTINKFKFMEFYDDNRWRNKKT